MKFLNNTLLALLFLLAAFLLIMQYVRASSSSPINATVKISICGNNVKEGGEDCDNSDLGGATCASLGYGGGTLTCDISCSYDTSGCIATPTPTATPTPSSTPTPTPTITVSVTSSTTTSTPTPGTATTSTITLNPTPVLPPALKAFDINGIGRILRSDLPAVVKIWVDDWQSNFSQQAKAIVNNLTNADCDLNRDGRCDLRDFSILMFYVGR